MLLPSRSAQGRLPLLYLLNGWISFSLPSYFYNLAYYKITSYCWFWFACILVGHSRFKFFCIIIVCLISESLSWADTRRVLMLLHDSRSSRLIVSGKTGRTLYVCSTLKQFPALCEPRDLMGPVSEPSVSHFTPPYTSFFKMFFPSVLSFPHVITFAIGSDKNSWQHISVLPCMLNAHPISSLFHRRRNVCQSAGLPHALKPLFFFRV